ncbi:MAG: 16S rRNA (cytidine(1402)-2'-O)-methyltransferase [Candidatus Eiseniibacteriota bacterium]
MAGLLRVVATPIGNLGDLSPRAREALASADVIAAEDTRRTGLLLQRLGISKKPMISYFAPREREKAAAIVARLAAGETVALVTDGGTPGVSDPGAVVVRAAVEAGARVEPVPGPSAVTAALSVSPAGGGPFVFEGFLPAKTTARRRRLEVLSGETRAIVVYEAPHRVAETLADMVAVFGAERRGTLVREATKMFEEVVDAPLGELASRFAAGAKGEIVIVVEGGEADGERVSVDVSALLELAVRAGLTPARAAKEVAAVTGVPRGRLMRKLDSGGGG